MTRFFVLLSFCLVLLVVPDATLAQDKAEKKPPVEKKKANPKVTAGNVTYVVFESEVTGKDRQWTLVLQATSNYGTQKILIAKARAITAEGKTCNVKAPMGDPKSRRTTRRTTSRRAPDGTVELPQGVKIQLELNMGPLPREFEDAKVVHRLELYGAVKTAKRRRRGAPEGVTTTTIPGQTYDPETKTVFPLVLENVPIERLVK